MRNKFGNTADKIEPCDEIVKSIWGPIQIRQGLLWGVEDEDHRQILPCKYEEVAVFPQGCIGAKLEEKWGLFNAKGEQIALCIYDDVDGDFSGDYIRVKLNGKWGLVYKDGQIALPCEYDDVDHFSGDYAPVLLNGKWGVVNEEGVEVFPCEYGHVTIEDCSEEGYTQFELDGKTCRIYDNGERYWD